MSWFKIYNLWRQVAPKSLITNEKYIPYFSHTDDSFPLKWHKAISESPSATSCVSTIGDFLEGFGFSDETLESKVVNAKGQTMFQIHQETVNSFKEFEGFYWLLRFNALGQVTEWEVLPFENCRLGKPDDKGYISKILYNAYFGTDDYRQNKDTLIYDVYNLKAVKDQIIEQGAKYKGQVFFFGTTTATSRFYPLPEAYSAIEWFKVEAGTGTYHGETLENGFLQDFMLIMKGNPDEPSKNPDYQDTNEGQPATVAQEFDDVISANFMGAKKKANMMVQWVNNPEEKPEVLPFPTNANGDLFVTIDNQATKKITIAFKVPAILANIHEGVSLGGDANQIRVAVKLMQQRVIKKQRILTDSYQKILANFDDPYTQPITIVPYNPYPELEVLDQKIWDALSLDEKRDWIEKNTEIVLTEAPALGTAAPAARVTNVVPVAFPEKIRAMVKKSLDYQEKMGLKCGGKAGREVSDAIISNQNMGQRQLKRIHSYLRKRNNLDGRPFNEGCEVIQYNAWGGRDMELFLEGKLKELDAWLN